MIFGKYVLGVLTGVFVIPAMIADPQGTVDRFQNIFGKVAEVVSYLVGVGEVIA